MINLNIFKSGISQMFFSTFSFAMANVFVKQLSTTPVMEIVFFRSVVAGLFCYIGIKRARVSWAGNNKPYLIFRGIAGTVALVLFFITLQNIPLASATTIQYLSPIFTATIAIFFLKEQVKYFQWFFYAIAFSGVLLIKNFDPRVSLFYLVIGVIAAFGSGVAYNFVRKLRETEHPLVIILYFQLVGLAVSIPALFFIWKTPVGLDWIYLLLVGVFSQLGQVFLTNAFHKEKAASVAIIVYTGLVYAISIGWLFYGEAQTLFTFLGMALVVVGVISSIIYGQRQKNIEKEIEATQIP
jgi:drug/metabolite transporter (DMT)-like permease